MKKVLSFFIHTNKTRCGQSRSRESAYCLDFSTRGSPYKHTKAAHVNRSCCV